MLSRAVALELKGNKYQLKNYLSISRQTKSVCMYMKMYIIFKLFICMHYNTYKY